MKRSGCGDLPAALQHFDILAKGALWLHKLLFFLPKFSLSCWQWMITYKNIIAKQNTFKGDEIVSLSKVEMKQTHLSASI